MDKQIINLKKQNEGMEIAFKNKNIEFTKLSTDNIDPLIELNLLQNYNEYLKTISKNNRPPPQEKPVKQEQKQQITPKKKEEDDDDQGEDDLPKEVKPVYSTIVNMEDIKRAFFNKEYEIFNTLIGQHPFKYYQVNYKYASDNTGRPSYVAKNLLRGFVQGLDEYRKYFIVCFRCILTNKETNEYSYPSYWIVNSNDDIKTILGSLYDDYEFNLLQEQNEITSLLNKMEKNENEEDDTLIGEIYLH
jgi:hypothetical protein